MYERASEDRDRTFTGLGFALGPVVTGATIQATGSTTMGLLAIGILSGLGVIAGLFA